MTSDSSAPHHVSLFASAIRGGVAAIGSDLAQKVTGLTATAIILASLSPYEYGLWQLILGASIAFGFLNFSGISSMLIADVSREIGAGNTRSAGALLFRAGYFFIGFGALAGVAMSSAAPFITAVSKISLTPLLQLVGLTLFAYGIRQIYQLVLQGSLALVHAQVLKAIDRFSYFVSIVFFVLILDLGLPGVVYGFTTAAFIPILIYFPIVWKRFAALTRDRERNGTQFVNAFWKRGKWALASDLCAAASGSLWPWLLGYYLSIEFVGFVSLALLLLGQVTSLVPLSYLLRSLLPRTLHSVERTHEWLIRAMRYAVVGYVSVGVFLFFVLAPISWLLPRYHEVLILFAALLPSLPLRAMTSISGEWFFAAQEQRELFFASSVPKLVMTAFLPSALLAAGSFGFVLWYISNTDILSYIRLRIIEKRIGREMSIKKIFTFDTHDTLIIDRAIELVRLKISQTFKMRV